MRLRRKTDRVLKKWKNIYRYDTTFIPTTSIRPNDVDNMPENEQGETAWQFLYLKCTFTIRKYGIPWHKVFQIYNTGDIEEMERVLADFLLLVTINGV